MQTKAIFFDRDGVLNHLVKRDGSLYSPQIFDDFKLVNTAKNVVKKIQDLGYLAIVISNQPDIARNKLQQSELDKMTNLLYKSLNINDVFYCKHDDNDECTCRKPSPGLILLAQEKYNINFDNSFMIGDTWKDVEAAKNVGITMILINADYNQDLTNKNRINNLEEMIAEI